LFALPLYGLNVIVASHITLSSYEIVFLLTMIGSLLLIVLVVLSKGKFHFRENKRDLLFILKGESPEIARQRERHSQSQRCPS